MSRLFVTDSLSVEAAAILADCAEVAAAEVDRELWFAVAHRLGLGSVGRGELTLEAVLACEALSAEVPPAGVVKALDAALGIRDVEPRLIERLRDASLRHLQDALHRAPSPSSGLSPSLSAQSRAAAAAMSQTRIGQIEREIQEVRSLAGPSHWAARASGPQRAYEGETLRLRLEERLLDALAVDDLARAQAVALAGADGDEVLAAEIHAGTPEAFQAAGRLVRAYDHLDEGPPAALELLLTAHRSNQARLAAHAWSRAGGAGEADHRHWAYEHRFTSAASALPFGGADNLRELAVRVIGNPQAFKGDLGRTQGVDVRLLVSEPGMRQLVEGGGERFIVLHHPLSAPAAPGPAPGARSAVSGTVEYLCLLRSARVQGRPVRAGACVRLGEGQAAAELARELGATGDPAREYWDGRVVAVWRQGEQLDLPEREAAEVFGAPPSSRCEHAHGPWKLNGPEDAFIRGCAECAAVAVEAVPVHRVRLSGPFVPELGAFHEAAYLNRQRFHQTLADDPRPVISIRQLRLRDGALMLTPTGAVPVDEGPPQRRLSLRQTLTSPVGRSSARLPSGDTPRI